MYFDIEKIARYVEELPAVPKREVFSILGLFRTGCKEMFKIIDPAVPSAREDLDRLNDKEYLAIREAIIGLMRSNIIDAMATICSTPRTLKQGLRSCLEIWKSLPGEVDLDDILLLSILRHAQPSAFAMLQEHLAYLRDGARLEDNDQKKARLAWDAALEKLETDERTRRAIEVLVSFVFNPKRGEYNPQGMTNHSHADYWERFLSMPRLALSEKDQPVLSTMLGEDDASLLSLLEDDRALMVEDFRPLLNPGRILRLLAPLVVRRSQEEADAWADGDPPGLIPLWRMWNRCPERSEVDALQEVKRSIEIAVPKNLGLAAKIEQHFVLASASVPDLLGKGRPEAKSYLRQLLVSTYSGHPETLAQSLRGARPQTLLWLCWGIDRVRSRDLSGLPFDGWNKFSGILLDAARTNPKVMLPQLAVLVTRGTSEREGNRYDFEEDLTTRLFGDTALILRLFENASTSDLPAAALPYINAVCAAAKARSRQSGAQD